MGLNRFQISEIAIEPDTLRSELENQVAGAYVSFEGWVRNHNEGASVQALEYSAYKVLAEKEASAEKEERQGALRGALQGSAARYTNTLTGEMWSAAQKDMVRSSLLEPTAPATILT